MATLKLKPNSRKTPPLAQPKPMTNDWDFDDIGVMRHSSGFTIQFFNDEECEIGNIPNGMALNTVRELTTEAIKTRKRRSY